MKELTVLENFSVTQVMVCKFAGNIFTTVSATVGNGVLLSQTIHVRARKALDRCVKWDSRVHIGSGKVYTPATPDVLARMLLR